MDNLEDLSKHKKNTGKRYYFRFLIVNYQIMFDDIPKDFYWEG